MAAELLENPLAMPRPMLDDVCRIAAAAGEIILGLYRRPLVVTSKADHSPVSEADRASHQYLMAALHNLTPDLRVVSEESEQDHATHGEAEERYWLVDPLDGTKEFIKGTDEFTVNIALIASCRPVLGVVLAPALGVTYCADLMTGAWRKDGCAAPVRIRTRPAAVGGLGIVASRDHAGPQIVDLVSRAPGAQLRSMGSSLKFCLVAEGKADVYLRDAPTMEWDTAAAQCVVEAAGGTVTELNGQPLMYGKPGLRNPAIMTIGDRRFCWNHLLG